MHSDKKSVSIFYVLGVVIVFLLVPYLAWRWMGGELSGTDRNPRDEVRKQAAIEARREGLDELMGYGTITASNDVRRIPIERAMAVVVETYQDPEKGRAEFLSRVERAHPPQPEPPQAPAAPEEPSPFE